MLFDHLSRASRYANLSERLARAFEFLVTMPLDLPLGRHDIVEGGELYALVSEYTTRAPAETRWEAHHRYADVQYLARGEEAFGLGQESDFTLGAFDAGRDLQWLEPLPDAVALQTLRLVQGYFIVLWPGEAHKPGVAFGEPAPVRKVVVKVLVEP
jgi:YhcH/YjgK/YiaL family protein